MGLDLLLYFYIARCDSFYRPGDGRLQQEWVDETPSLLKQSLIDFD